MIQEGAGRHGKEIKSRLVYRLVYNADFCRIYAVCGRESLFPCYDLQTVVTR